MGVVGAALAVGALGLGMQTMAAYRSADAQNQANEYNAGVMTQNAQLAQMQADQAEENGKLEEKQLRWQLSQVEGQQRSTFGSSGVQTNTGSALDTLEDTVAQGEIDALNVRYNSQQTANQYRTQATNYLTQAGQLRSSYQSPFLAAGTTLLGGGSSLANSYLAYRR